MGRCNNRRTQQAAEAMRHTPARARFSNGPAAAVRRKKTTGRDGAATAAATIEQNAGRGTGGSAQAETKKSVVQKIAQRVEKTITQTKNKRPSSLHGVNVHSLDQVKLSEQSIKLIFQLLKDLNVVEQQQQDDDSAESDEDSDVPAALSEEESYFLYQQQHASSINGNESALGQTTTTTTTTGGYEEYEDDGYEQDEYENSTDAQMIRVGAATEDEPRWEGEGAPNTKNRSRRNGEVGGGITDDTQLMLLQLRDDDPVYRHLTDKLSFPAATAARACRAVETWSAVVVVPTTTTNNSEQLPKSSTSSSKQANDNIANKLSHVMDWLCLHLSETELEAGFKPNRSNGTTTLNTTNTSGLMAAGTTGRRQITTKAIPHPSITVAKKLTDDVEWRRQTAREERALQFLKLGFEHADIIAALQTTDPESTRTCCTALDDTVTLCVLLASLEQRVLLLDGDDDDNAIALTTTVEFEDDDNDDAEAEREQEREALSAIYEDHFQVLKDAKAQSRYKISVTMGSGQTATADDSIGDLYVFLRPGYPAQRTPLFLLHNPSLPWPFLRRVNAEILRTAQQGIGGPVIFEAVTQLVDLFPSMLDDYRKEQSAKEFEETQLRLRKEAGHDVTEDEALLLADLTDEDMKNLSRRQRAKLKGAEKAFDRGEKEKQDEERRKKQQEDRLERIKGDNKYIRQSMADRAVLQRENERLEDGLRKATRSAMSMSLNRGESVEEARAAAKEAEVEYRKEHAMEITVEEKNEIEDTADSNDNPGVENGDSYEIKATPTTMAFMERLRSMYANAASGKVGYDLSNPAEEDMQEKDKRPCPIAVPVGDLARIMEDHVLAVQKEQPWLVAPEARVPCLVDRVSGQNGLELPALTERQKEISHKLQKDLAWSLKNPSKQVLRIREQTHQLPAYQMRNEIVATVNANQVTLISASTGAGKTTVVPTLLLNDMIQSGLGFGANIWVTQPRRISAIGVAERIASERGEKVGETCGYSIKLEKKCSRKTRITLCTTGILLRRLQCDPDLANISHLIIDEVHERDINSDFALIILKELLQRRKSLKLILMSATFDKGIFAEYFEGCATVEIPGRAHPVQEFRLEDVFELTGYEVQEGSDYAVKANSDKKAGRMSKAALKKLYHKKYSSKTIHSLSIVDESVINYELVAAVVEHLSLNGEGGAILVFMPGMAEISNAIDELRKKELFQSDKVVIYPLHSSLATSEQTQVFEVPPEGIRKIVVATNIAETSITVSDVLYVVDAGRVKENRRDEIKEAPTLVDCWVSKASAQQRRGRAGRVRPGIAYHLFSTHTYDMELQEYQLPEISRVGIEDLVLQVLILDLGEPSIFLAGALTPPSAVAMKSSLKLLEELGAVECQWQAGFIESETCASLAETTTELTALGFHLATLPVEPRIGKLIIYGALFGCVEPALTIAAAMSSKSPFLSPFGNRDAADEARRTFSVDGSDHLTILEAFNQWKALRASSGERATNSFIRDSFLSRMTLFQMDELRKQYAALLGDIGFLPSGYRFDGNTQGSKQTVPSDANVNGGNTDLLKAVLCAGLYPNIILAPRPLVNGTSKQEAGEMAFQSRSKGEVYLHPSTLSFSAKQLEYRYCCFREIMQTRKLYVRDATVVSPFALLLFGGALHVYHTEGVVTVDEWLKFRIDRTPATLVKYLRAQMESMLLRKIVAPDDDVSSTPEAKAVIESISTLLQHERRVKLGDAARTDGAEIVHPWNGSDHGAHGGRGRPGGGGGRGRQSGGRGRGQGRGRGRARNH